MKIMEHKGNIMILNEITVLKESDQKEFLLWFKKNKPTLCNEVFGGNQK